MKYLIMDGRAKTNLGDYPAERAIVLEACTSLEEARKRKKEWGDTCIVDSETGKILWEGGINVHQRRNIKNIKRN